MSNKIIKNDIEFQEKHFGEEYYLSVQYWAGRMIDLSEDRLNYDIAEEIVETLKYHKEK